MADTTTTLNPGSGGDKMDESLVTQSDGLTQAKRQRVVVGGDAGFDGTQNDLVQPVAADPGENPMSLPALATALVNDSPRSYTDGELRSLSLTSEGRLRVASVSASTYMDMFGDTRPISTDPDDFNFAPRNNPWGL